MINIKVKFIGGRDCDHANTESIPQDKGSMIRVTLERCLDCSYERMILVNYRYFNDEDGTPDGDDLWITETDWEKCALQA